MYNVYSSNVDAWKRPSELDGSSPSLWGTRGVLPNGVNQGNLGDCWFLASAAAIAEHPERIKKIFTNKEYSAEGIFEMTFYKKGKPVTEVVDDRLPVKSQGSESSPINSRKSPYGAWWLPILEKAYAKLHANYANLNGGQPSQALRDLTGMPFETFQIENQNDELFWQIVSEADQNRWVMTAACMKEAYGLVTMHAYTILGVLDL